MTARTHGFDFAGFVGTGGDNSCCAETSPTELNFREYILLNPAQIFGDGSLVDPAGNILIPRLRDHRGEATFQLI
jgi:hypothetical protein